MTMPLTTGISVTVYVDNETISPEQLIALRDELCKIPNLVFTIKADIH